MGRRDRPTPPANCNACGDTGRVPWMVEGDPNRYQEPDEDGAIPCLDCRPSPPANTGNPEEGHPT